MPIRTGAQRARLLCTVPVILLCAAPAAAQDNEGFFQVLGRIILGTGTAKVAIDTPQAVSTIEAEELERDQPSNIGDLFKSVPGVQGAGASARPLGQAFNIRGIGNSEQTASEARIIVNVDGAPKFYESYRMGSFFGDLDLYKRVEVLKGPASSTLYGSGAIGGAVNFTTRDASDFLEEGETRALRFSSTYDSNGDGVKLGIISATRAGNAEYLAGFNVSTGNDKVDGAGNRIAGTAYEGMSGLLKGRWYFGEDEEQSLTLTLSRTDSDLDRTPVAQTGGATVGAFGLHDLHAVDDTLTLAWRNEFRDNPLLDVTAQLSYTDTSVEKDNYTLGASCAPGTFQVLCDSSYGYATTTLKLENTADLSAGAWENYLTVGVQVSEQKRSATSSLGALGFHPEGTDRRMGLYAQGEFTYGERLTIIPGVRVDFGKQTPGASAAAAGALVQDDTAISPKIAAMYELNDSFAVFGSLARTERMPTLDELYSSEAAGVLPARTPSLNLKKEEADTVELGFTFQREGWLAEGDSFQMKVTAFHNDLTNMIATTPRVAGGPAVPYFSNIAAAELWGAEVEAAYDADRWFAQLAYAHVKSKNRATGLTLPDTPAENVVLTVGAKLPEQGLTIGWRASYFDKIRTSSATTSGASYDTHDIFLTWSPEEGPLAGLDVNLSVENVFDRAYRNNLSLDNAVGRTAKLSVAKRITF
ncbi:TonB-dependent receptor domain-containing protein [Paragemmobacter ruber]|uniref:TonB-dependent receptor n=1 Tax=Paragemmobacter ruber TaxID=1985673 RepID=A0ABW9Y222_9RHOB|nr:TonB-dependent receptor [Rhodobacter ruber]NBE06438.1 TonB-dependent receptor [Rhodobacter ruber]